MSERKLSLSDFITKEELEIKNNPYQFLGLPVDATPEQAREAYIRLSKEHHPDMIKQQLMFRGEKLQEQLDKRRNEAHKKMILINRAYEEIKSRHNPNTWRNLFGYKQEYVSVDDGVNIGRQIYLEGLGKITIYSEEFEYWVTGPYLSFDLGPDLDHPWVFEDHYRGAICLKHLFAHQELSDGKPLTRQLLDPFIKTFKLEEQEDKLVGLLQTAKLGTEESTIQIMNELGVKDDGNYARYLRFRRQLNEMISLSCEPSDREVTVRFDNNKNFIIKNNQKLFKGSDTVNETVFSEADYYLFITLAYNPLLK